MWLLSVKQTARIISTYTGDTSGVCSALYELGGMTVMHDASGCNSTYNTHDEPRWYDMDSLVFLSGLTEMEALMGDDGKLIGDVVRAAEELSPRFIALAGTPIPMLTGVDFQAVAMEIEQKTGIPTFGFSTDGMHSYISGASMAFAAVARRLCAEPGIAERAAADKEEPLGQSGQYQKQLPEDSDGNRGSVYQAQPSREKDSPAEVDSLAEVGHGLTANILGVTPLDFTVNGTDRAMVRALEQGGFQVGAVWAMGSRFEEIARSGEADVNLVVSACGLEAAEVLKERFGIPYVVGTPCGEKFTGKLLKALKRAAETGENEIVCQPCETIEDDCGRTVIIGESVTALSLANALKEETGRGALVLCAVDTVPALLSEGCIQAWDEDDLKPWLEGAARIIADPLYRPICPENARFLSLPHEAFSGRIYRAEIPELVTGLKEFIEEHRLQ